MGGKEEEYTRVKPRKNNYRRRHQDEHQHQQKLKFVAKDQQQNNKPCPNVGPTCNNKNNNIKTKSNNNLARFIEATVPCVPAQFFSKTTMKGFRCDVDYQHYFTLEDLWDSFKEPSAYGAGVPLVLGGPTTEAAANAAGDGLVQYYVPYLSAIQLYGQPSNSKPESRLAGDSGEDSDGNGGKVSSTDGSSDYEIVEDLDSISLQEHFVKMDDVPSHEDVLSSSDKQHKSEVGLCNDDTHAGIARGQLLFQFFEQQSPYCREPLAIKVGGLADWFPQLKTLRSCDLLPSSWMSVAWYPIYRIPSGSALRDLDACFLTYHCLATPPKGEDYANSPELIESNEFDGSPRFLLPAFGLASYKFKGEIWTDNRDCACPLVNSLMPAANRWLRLLQVNHPDYEFFLSRSAYNR